MAKIKNKKLKMLSIDWNGNLVPENSKKLEGISGWLTLWEVCFWIIGIGIFIESIFLFGVSITGNNSQLNILKDVSPIIVIPLMIVVWAILGYLFYIFYTKKKKFVFLIKTLLVLGLICQFFNSGLNMWMIIDVLWLGYFFKSQRVKNTFTN